MLEFFGSVVNGAAVSELVDGLRSWLRRENDPKRLDTHALILRELQTLNAKYDPGCTFRKERTVTLSTNPTPLDREGRAHNMILASSAFNLVIQVPGLPAFTEAIGAGWSLLDLPDGTTYAVDTGRTTILYRVDNQSIGTAI